MKTQAHVIAALLTTTVTSSAVTSVTTTYASTLSCSECIRGGYLYNIDTTNAGLRSLITTASGLDYDGECCTDDTDTTNCATSLASSGNLATNYVSVNPFGVDMDIALHSCPTKETFCGSTKEIEFADTSAATQAITISTSSSSYTTSDQCTYLVKATCGAPGIIMDYRVNEYGPDVEIFYMEYATVETTFDSTDTNWPAYYTTGSTAQICGVPDYSEADTVDSQGEMPYFKVVTQVSPETYRSVPGKMVADWMYAKKTEIADFDEAVTYYDVLRAEYDTYVTEWNAAWNAINDADQDSNNYWSLGNILDFYFGKGMHAIQEKMKPPVPQTPIAYTGPELYNSVVHSTTLGYLQKVETWGLGKLTADVLTVAGGGHAFGVLGQGEDPTLSAKFTAEAEDSSNCSPSYFVVTIIPVESQSVSGNDWDFTATVGSYDWGFNFDSPTIPTAATALEVRLDLPLALTDWMFGYYGDATY